MSIESHDLTLRALAALFEIAEQAGQGDVKPTLATRLILRLLYERSDRRDRKPYDGFWQASKDRRSNELNRTTANFLRGRAARRHWLEIVGTLGLPMDREFEMKVWAIVHEKP